MTKFLVLWQNNMLAPWPADRREVEENAVAMFEAIDRYVDGEIVTENAFFADAESGCFVFQGTTEDLFNMTSMFSPFVKYEVQEMIPYELGKNMTLENLHTKTLAR